MTRYQSPEAHFCYIIYDMREEGAQERLNADLRAWGARTRMHPLDHDHVILEVRAGVWSNR